MNRRTRLIRNFRDKTYRDTYVDAFLNSYIAAQVRALRGGEGIESRRHRRHALNTKQSGVSKLENVNYSGWNVRTLKKLAKAFDVALVVKFVAFSEALADIDNFDAKALVKPTFAEDRVFHSVEPVLASGSTNIAATQVQTANSSGPVYTHRVRSSVDKSYAERSPKAPLTIPRHTWRPLLKGDRRMPQPKKEKTGRTMEVSRREPQTTLYANHAAITITPWDFAFRFGTIVEATEKKLTAREDLSVYMSPQHAKAFLGLVDRQVKLFEEKYGPIPEPKACWFLPKKE